jgi:hypothetical protein
MGRGVGVDGGLEGSDVFSFVIGEAGKIVLTGSEGIVALLEVSLESLEFIGRHGDREEGRRVSGGRSAIGGGGYDFRVSREGRPIGH